MHHCFIAPTEYLRYVPKSNVHLLLAHLLKDKRYVDFYQEQQRNGAELIVDNGAFEFKRPLESDELFKLCNDAQLVPDYIVAPDYPYEDWAKTVQSTEAFLTRYTEYFPKSTKVMAVPQSVKGDWIGWCTSYNKLLEMPISMIGMSIIGIPNAFCSVTLTEDISFNRIYATQYLQQFDYWSKKTKHHYLGCSDPREIKMLQILGAYSNDSSTAIWHGILGKRFDTSGRGLESGKDHTPVDFDLPFDSKHEEDILYNVKWIENLLHSALLSLENND